MKIEKWLKENTESLIGKKIAITGSTGGLGREICLYLAKLGAELVLLDRNESRSAALADSLTESVNGLKITRIRVDLEDMESVKSATEKLKSEAPDIFIHNAGAYSIPRKICDSGYDNVFQINFVSPYYMIKELIPTLEEREGRVVVVGSIAHNYSKTDASDVDFRTRKAASKVYGNAKRYLMYSILALAKTREKVKFSVVHPGITFTNITAHYPKLIFMIIKHPMKVIFMKPKVAALSIVRGLFLSCEGEEWIGPRIFDVWGLPKKKKLKTANIGERDYIYKTAEEIYKGLKQ